MRKLLLIGGAAALIALPASALATDTPELVKENDPLAEGVAAAPAKVTTDKALHADGRGFFRYEGSGGVVLTGTGVVRVKDFSLGKDLVKTPAGFGTTQTFNNGLWTRYTGKGTLTLDGSSFRVSVSGDFTADADPTATHLAVGKADVAGHGQTILKGGIAVPFWANRNLLLTSGALSVDLFGHGGREWWHKGKDHKGPKGEGGHKSSETTHGKDQRWWRWNGRANGATWRIHGPAAGSVDITTISGRVRVWDRSQAKDLAVGVPAGTPTETLGDGSVVYSHLRSAHVTLAGTAFGMKASATDIEGTFTPTAGSLARSYVRGKGTFDVGGLTGIEPGRRSGVRLLLQPTVVAPK